MELTMIDKIIGGIVAVLIVVALMPTVFTAIQSGTIGGNGTTGTNWSAITLGSTTYSFLWVPYVLGLLILVGVVYFFMKHFGKM